MISQNYFHDVISGKLDDDCSDPDTNIVHSSPKMMSLWKRAIEANKAILLDEIDLGPDDLLRKVEEFENISQATEHSYPALILSREDGADNIISAFEDSSPSESLGEDGTYADEYEDDDEYEDNEYYDSDSSEEVDASVPLGSLPVDLIADKLDQA